MPATQNSYIALENTPPHSREGCCFTVRVFSVLLSGVNGLRMLGVVHEAVVFLLEQLYGSRHCRSYRFRFHKPEETDEPPLNPHGSARAEVHHRLEQGLICNIHFTKCLGGKSNPHRNAQKLPFCRLLQLTVRYALCHACGLYATVSNTVSLLTHQEVCIRHVQLLGL